MADNYLQSKATGTWTYEVPENGVKSKYQIKFGINEIPNSHKKVLEEDLGFQAKTQKKLYKWLTGKKEMAAAKTADEDVVEKSDPKAEYKKKISELKAENEEALKRQKNELQAEVQKYVNLRGEEIQKNKDLEAEVKSLKVDLADFEGKKQKEVDSLKDENKKLKLEVNKLEKENKDLKVKK